jgi:hypothetical protein
MYYDHCDPAVPHRARFDRTLERLLPETHNLMFCQAVFESLSIIATGAVLKTSLSALKSDRLIRLIRIFEESEATANFWYLLRCEPKSVGQGLDVAFLKQFSQKLKLIRDKSFVHIDKDAVFDPDAIYQAAGVTSDEMIRSMGMLWSVLNRLYAQRFGRPYSGMTSLEDFRQIARKSASVLERSRV